MHTVQVLFYAHGWHIVTSQHGSDAIMGFEEATVSDETNEANTHST